MYVGAFPLWVTLLQWLSPKTDATTVPVTETSHMQMSQRTSLRAGDDGRAQTVLAGARRVVVRYGDLAAAQRDGYRLFHEEPVGHEEHYTNWRLAQAEGRGIEPDRPGSLLYRHEADGTRRIVGVMYGAPAGAGPAELDARLPRSIATWHRHVDFCWGARDSAATDDRFGFAGSIHEPEPCRAAGGAFVPVVFGWMTHVYPGESDPRRVWGGEVMQMDDRAPHEPMRM